MKYTYLLVNLCSVIVPFLFSFHPRLKFYTQWRSFFPAVLITAIFFLVWDALFTRLGVWGFNPDYVLGHYLLGMPIEEWMFFVCIPYACVFTYHCLEMLFKRRMTKPLTNALSTFLIVFLFSGAITNLSNYYTASTFILCAAMIAYCQFYQRVPWLNTFYPVYAILLLPFLIVNGILTGSGIDEPVVWYNESHILGIRIFTIPFEDVFYGMLLILMNVSLLKFFKTCSDRTGQKPCQC